LRTPKSNKIIEREKISCGGPNTSRIFEACGERGKKLNTHVVSKNLGNRYGALTLKKQ
jgi:hypothetical protein